MARVAAMAQIQPLAQEILHAPAAAKKKKNRQKKKKEQRLQITASFK